MFLKLFDKLKVLNQRGITSDKCYKNYEKNKGYSETDELGEDPYSASKAAAENIFFIQ